MIYQSKIFMSNQTQNVRLPADLHFPDNVKEVIARSKSKEQIIAPAQNTWDSFFLSDQSVTDDFLPERPDQVTNKRESFDD
ncbi:type II toxin-antitoxin system VapB family antitoxin [Photorhabdus sp. RW14-46]|uniref:type II toxin-antitoxin system VapB family antitoxin n=2 Tax=Morganellaceae TaxID=1903414 RepID=UPI0013F3DCFE|nr:type II toxin-antitoxin system VapB family antitoxin [Photorhabdus sp. RW14-46]NHB63429.1 AbrB/MazE/SpoVT family DNA-binding domain-containing protein [Photorhabdus sp. RW14-46]